MSAESSGPSCLQSFDVSALDEARFGKSCVVKLGGSLLDWAEFPAAFQRVLQPIERAAIVVGGGRIADEIRRFHERFPISEAAAHEIAIQSMGITERLVSTLIDRPVVSSRSELLAKWQLCGSVVINAEHCLNDSTIARPDLPASWATTSDSIAAALAIGLNADLILLKSVELSAKNWADAAELDFVDRHFPTLANDVRRIHWINLRSL